MKEESVILFSATSSKMFKDDPLTCFLMEWTGCWELSWKEEDDLEKIAQKAGLSIIEMKREELGFHIIAKAKRS